MMTEYRKPFHVSRNCGLYWIMDAGNRRIVEGPFDSHLTAVETLERKYGRQS